MVIKRRKQPLLRRLYWQAHGYLRDLKSAKRSADAAYSAYYILMDLNNPEGIDSLAELTGLPEGVIVSAMRNIFIEDKEL